MQNSNLDKITHKELMKAFIASPALTEQQTHAVPDRRLSSVIIWEVNKPQSSTKLCIFGSAFQILHKALTKPVWAGSSAQLSNTAHKLFLSLKIPVVLCICAKWLLGFLLPCSAVLFLQQSAAAASHQSSFGRVGALLSVLLKSLWLARTFLPLQAHLPSLSSSPVNLTVRFHHAATFAQHVL